MPKVLAMQGLFRRSHKLYFHQDCDRAIVQVTKQPGETQSVWSFPKEAAMTERQHNKTNKLSQSNAKFRRHPRRRSEKKANRCTLAIKAFAIGVCAIVGLNADPALSTALNSIAWFGMEIANDRKK